jgi:DNA-directed RNA polymerase specialized sigma24 family protein
MADDAVRAHEECEEEDEPHCLCCEERAARGPRCKRHFQDLLRAHWRNSGKLVCVATVIDGRISVSEQALRGGHGTGQKARDDASGPEKRPPVLPQAVHGAGTSPIADLDPRGINYRAHPQLIGIASRYLDREIREEAEYVADASLNRLFEFIVEGKTRPYFDFNKPESFKRFLFRTCRQMAWTRNREFRRQNKVVRPPDGPQFNGDGMPVLGPDPDAESASPALLSDVEEALDGLSEIRRQVYVLLALHGVWYDMSPRAKPISYDQASEILGITVKKVRDRLHDARELFPQLMRCTAVSRRFPDPVVRVYRLFERVVVSEEIKKLESTPDEVRSVICGKIAKKFKMTPSEVQQHLESAFDFLKSLKLPLPEWQGDQS